MENLMINNTVFVFSDKKHSIWSSWWIRDSCKFMRDTDPEKTSTSTQPPECRPRRFSWWVKYRKRFSRSAEHWQKVILSIWMSWLLGISNPLAVLLKEMVGWLSERAASLFPVNTGHCQYREVSLSRREQESTNLRQSTILWIPT